ncbi:hypothetical protein FRX31_006972, partial [Thalictrum thalictroides]
KRIKEGTKQLNALQLRLENNPTDDSLAAEIQEVEESLEETFEQQAQFWQQKAAIKWQHEADRSTRDFFALASAKKSRSFITEMKDEQGNMLTNQQDIANFIVEHYKQKFTRHNALIDDKLLQLIPEMLSEDDAKFLEAIPTAAE